MHSFQGDLTNGHQKEHRCTHFGISEWIPANMSIRWPEKVWTDPEQYLIKKNTFWSQRAVKTFFKFEVNVIRV